MKTNSIFFLILAFLLTACSQDLFKADNKELFRTAANLLSSETVVQKPTTHSIEIESLSAQPPKGSSSGDNEVKKIEAKYKNLTGSGSTAAARSAWWNAASLPFKKAIITALKHQLNGCTPSSSDAHCILPINADGSLTDAQITTILTFNGLIPFTADLNLDTLAISDLEVLRSMELIKKIGFISANPLAAPPGKIKGKISQKIINYLPTSLTGIYIDGIDLTATDLTNLTNLISIWIPTGSGNNDFLTSKTGVKIPTSAGFNKTDFSN